MTSLSGHYHLQWKIFAKMIVWVVLTIISTSILRWRFILEIGRHSEQTVTLGSHWSRLLSQVRENKAVSAEHLKAVAYVQYYPKIQLPVPGYGVRSV